MLYFVYTFVYSWTNFQEHFLEDENYKNLNKFKNICIDSYIVTYIYINGYLESKLQTVTRAAKPSQLYMSCSQYNNTYIQTRFLWLWFHKI